MGRFRRLLVLHGSMVAIGVVGILVSFLGMPGSTLFPFVLGCVALFVGFVGLVGPALEDLRRSGSIYESPRLQPVKADYTSSYENWSRVAFKGRASIHHEDIDRLLQASARVAIATQKTPWEPSEECEDVRRLIRIRLDFDDEKVRLANDLLPESTNVLLQKTQYSSFKVTNLLGETALRQRGRSGELLDPTAVLLRNGVIPALGHSGCSNHIGVDVIAVSSSGRIFLPLQGERNTTSKGLLAPSGSGSMDWSDLHGCNDLVGLVRNAMRRELTEEMGLTGRDVPAVDDLQVLRYARVTNWGGKPQFFGVARVGDVRAEVRGLEKRYHDDYEIIDFDPDSGAKSLVAAVSSFNTEQAERISFPLFENLLVLCDWLEADPTAWPWLTRTAG